MKEKINENKLNIGSVFTSFSIKTLTSTGGAISGSAICTGTGFVLAGPIGASIGYAFGTAFGIAGGFKIGTKLSNYMNHG